MKLTVDFWGRLFR